LYAGKRGIPVWTLEHALDWHQHISNALSHCHIAGVHISLAPLWDYDHFAWYSPPLRRMPEQFTLVVCDGPPERTTPGKRYGLLPVMGKRLVSGCVILLDDVNTDTKDNVVDHWTAERLATIKILKADNFQSFGLILLD
jgi:hypothetical protein